MSAESGQQLLHYRLIEKIGEGGMGVVWKAVDTTLDREVAIKVLPAALSNDPDRLARLDREAKLLASLNHPNIATVHGLHTVDQTRFLVMELVHGEDLAARLKRGRLTVDDALRIAIQIGHALQAAHEKGIIHRDLKPGNIIVSEGDSIKVLDFGLAKSVEPSGTASGGDSLSMSPTMTSAGTMAGMILGTASYMSPEQARGKPVDRRTDIWALGVVFYEMLTGSSVFPGEDVSEVLAGVIKSDPDWKALPPDLPSTARVALLRCLRRNLDERFADASGVRILFEQALEEFNTGPDSAVPGITRSRSNWLPWVLIIPMVIAALLLQSRIIGERENPAATLRYSIDLAPGDIFNYSHPPYFDLTPDEQAIVYAATVGGVSGLYWRSLDSFESQLLPGTLEAFSPFISPDGKWIGFVADGKLKRTTATGLKPTSLCNVPELFQGGSWSPDGSIVYSPDTDSGLWRISGEEGAIPEKLTEPNREVGEVSHVLPSVLPDGDGVVFQIKKDGTNSDGDIALLSLSSGEMTILVRDASGSIRYLESGFLIMKRAEQLIALPFDLKKQRATGSPFALFPGEARSGQTGQVAKFTASPKGAIVYTAYGTRVERTLVELDREGNERPLTTHRHYFLYPAISPDQRQVAVTQDGQTWLYEIEGGRRVRLTMEGTSYAPLWIDDGSRLLFGSYQPAENLYSMPADGSEPSKLVLERENRQYPAVWHAPTRQTLLTWSGPTNGYDIWTMDEDGTAAPLLDSPANERWPTLSPDGRYLAYASDESGRYEIYVREFAEDRGKRVVTSEGGIEPRWSPRGDEIFYKSGDGLYRFQTELKAVSVKTGSRLTFGKTVTLLEGPYISGPCCGHSYDVTLDGKRFIMVKEQEDAPRQRMSVVLNGLGNLIEH